MDHYDRLLGGMFVALLLGAVVGSLPSVVFHRGLLGGALLATVFFWQAVFRNPPVSPSNRRTAAIAVVWHGGLLLGFAAVW